ncbi:hypothetical protein [Nocardioides caricicola]|uniref:Lipoprotein n=1 Tax=Nocardioides caricicola TaxID=634770 RepID=A0ABW0N920_9ACTN
MFSTRRTLAVTALCAATLLTGCSGSDGSDGGDAGDSSASASETPAYEAPCTATVEITGKAEKSWEGGADLTEGGGGVTYSTADGDANVLVSSGVKKQPGSVTVAVAGDIFQSKPNAKGINADPDGSGAEVDTDVTGTIKNKPVTLQVVATFTCED